MKIIITGYGRHGKDTAAEYIRDKYNLSFCSSSLFVAERAVLPHMPQYSSVEEAYNDRHNHREQWYNLICNYNSEDPSRLGRELLSIYDMYVGLRSALEFRALKPLVTATFWVDRSKVLPPEPSTSITILPEMCDLIIDNNSTLQNLYFNIDKAMRECNLLKT